MKISPRLLMGRRITHTRGQRRHWHPSRTAWPSHGQTCETCSAAHSIRRTPEKSLGRGAGAAPCGKTCPSFSSGGWKPAPLDGASGAAETWPAETLGRICIVPPGTVLPTASHHLSAHQQLTPVGAGFEEDEELVVLEEDRTPQAISWACWLLTRRSPAHPAPCPSTVGRATSQVPRCIDEQDHGLLHGKHGQEPTK